ncbi:hypothetical protein SI859A1_01402 [Aurantimonas manganoxydans SI85-9A1]|uniref:Uncharacterized protein n=1 Tax=Aurantimonas manganoxydans (strain ATCC BAA-1229 / DSM 21871 / SI85-9A1) TaxID=287752 RepID=Q1YIS0_AURMS|nr:hypothetical protein SI859A1_01402 [Aurantimonas manganoxydans SI85-9A1]
MTENRDCRHDDVRRSDLRGLREPNQISRYSAGEASWRSGYAEDCKSLHGGSIPSEASSFFPYIAFMTVRCRATRPPVVVCGLLGREEARADQAIAFGGALDGLLRRDVADGFRPRRRDRHAVGRALDAAALARFDRQRCHLDHPLRQGIAGGRLRAGRNREERCCQDRGCRKLLEHCIRLSFVCWKAKGVEAEFGSR